MDFGQAITVGFQNYVNFNGRSQRSAFWWWIVFVWIVQIIAGIIDFVIFGTYAIYYAAALVLLLPNIAVQARRLHDTDRSGWFMLLALIPIVGAIILLIWYCQRGTNGPNRFGPDPLPV
jgi:uncharacterized membrane protein YhaH (DUF805 family)